jgi:hypothetical protein
LSMADPPVFFRLPQFRTQNRCTLLLELPWHQAIV